MVLSSDLLEISSIGETSRLPQNLLERKQPLGLDAEHGNVARASSVPSGFFQSEIARNLPDPACHRVCDLDHIQAPGWFGKIEPKTQC